MGFPSTHLINAKWIVFSVYLSFGVNIHNPLLTFMSDMPLMAMKGY